MQRTGDQTKPDRAEIWRAIPRRATATEEPTTVFSPPARRSVPARSTTKRVLDVVLTLVAAPVAVPLGLLLALLIVATSRGPIFFFQERIGLDGRHFRMLKFRTMHIDAERRLREDPELWDEYVHNDFKLPASLDSRVTLIGRFLRRSSLDELPQVVNVLHGTMSLVGPRPVVPEELDNYGAAAGAYLSVRPGITGLWQVSGRSDVPYPRRVELDCSYIDAWSVGLDLRILVRTPFAVLSGRGAF